MQYRRLPRGAVAEMSDRRLRDEITVNIATESLQKQLSQNLLYFYLELTLPQENVPLPLLAHVGPKVWSSTPNDIKYSTTFTFKWKLKKRFLYEKYTQL